MQICGLTFPADKGWEYFYRNPERKFHSPPNILDYPTTTRPWYTKIKNTPNLMHDSE
jgi:hypothetical protein